MWSLWIIFICQCWSIGFAYPVSNPLFNITENKIKAVPFCASVCMYSFHTAAVCCHCVCSGHKYCSLVWLVSSGTWCGCQTPVGVCARVCYTCVMWWAVADLESWGHCWSFYYWQYSGGATTHGPLGLFFCVPYNPLNPCPVYLCKLVYFSCRAVIYSFFMLEFWLSSLVFNLIALI